MPQGLAIKPSAARGAFTADPTGGIPVKLLAPILAVAAALALAAPATAADSTVVMTSMSYGRMPAGLKVGDTITWTNRDTVIHSVTARDRSFDLKIPPGKSAKLTLQKAGTIAFFCTYHTAMRGTLTVAAK